MNDSPTNCPKCSSDTIAFIQQTGQYFCTNEKCSHRWVEGEPTQQSTPDSPDPLPAIFLSYGRGDDEPFVERLHRELTARGFDVWFDRVNMPSRKLTFHQEILDAISVRNRLLLVVGPHAISSDYVRQEWEFALRADKVVNPILRLGDYPLVPDELKLLHCEDFRDDERFDFHLDNLARQLAEPPPPLGKLIAVPSLPPHYLARKDRLLTLRDALRSDLDRPVVVTGETARIGVHGMGGIGKSVMASALAHDRIIREAFPDGIIWVAIGSQQDDIPELQRRVHRELGGDGVFQTVSEGRIQLTEILADKSVLLILDDVWRRSDADAFDVLGPRCRALVTTRDAGLLTSLGGTHHVVELLTNDEAFNLLGMAVGLATDELPTEAAEIINECGRLPLAIALCSGMLQAGTPWIDVLTAMREHELEFLSDEHASEPQHRSMWRAIEVSVAALDENHRTRLAELSVFPPDEQIPEAAVLTLWQHTGGLSQRQSRQLLIQLKQRSLVQINQSPLTSTDQVGEVSLHDLIYDYASRSAQRKYGSLVELTTQLLEAYRSVCPDGWHSGPNDGYFFQHLCGHFIAIDGWDDLETVLTDLRYVQAACTAGMTFGLVRDYNDALAVLPELESERAKEEQRLRQYGQDLIAYAKVKGEGVPLPEPPDSRVAHESMRRAEAASSAPVMAKVEPSQSSRIRNFANFASSHSHQLSLFPEQTLPIAFNHASGGPVADQAESLLDSSSIVWLRREPRPPSPPENPVCLRKLELGTKSVDAVTPPYVDVVTLTLDGLTAVSGGNDKMLHVWDVATGQLLRTLEGHTSRVTAVALTPDGNTAVSGSDSFADNLRVWDIATGQLLRTLEGHSHWVTAVSLTPDGHTAVSASEDKTLRVWDVATGQLLRTLEGHTDRITAVSLTAHGNTAVSASYDKTLRVWDVATGQLLRTLEGHTDRVTAVSLTANGNTAVSASEEKTLRVWDVTTGQLLRTLEGHTSRVTAVALTPDGNTAVSGSSDQTLRVWDIATGQLLRTLEGHSHWVTAVSLTPDGDTVISASADNTLRLWDIATGELVAVHSLDASGMSVAVALDDRIVAGTGSGQLHFLTLQNWPR